RSWIVWEEEGRYPDVIVELMSPSTASADIGKKKDLYERTFRTQDYFVYDPFHGESLQGWHLNRNQDYEELAADERGWLWCESLGLWLGTWDGQLRRENASWLRFYEPDGNLVLLPEEVAERERAEKEQERERANRAESDVQRLRERLQQLGIDPDTVSDS
ncbi:Uma2 family endonuclease, partial [Spirulina sp. CS-785/01]|uniref:Uma2 family endonuclease n=1 Tax=Spirulina sp. CS-785/01 TaxID=3021716 RepID=UPI00232F0042